MIENKQYETIIIIKTNIKFPYNTHIPAVAQIIQCANHTNEWKYINSCQFWQWHKLRVRAAHKSKNTTLCF